ncbi:MAG: HAD family hydrolase [Novosphingobium sp.]|nr:HAD family hydrolase [Novosphingobium sp.]
MSRPLVISDCDDVLLHMVSPFREWLSEAHGIRFDLSGGSFLGGLTYAQTGEVVAAEDIWPLLRSFFEEQMHRQYPIAGAVAALAELSAHADIVILTNIGEELREARALQLAEHGMQYRVIGSHGPKGPPLRAILDEYGARRAIFIDDLAQHHGSVAEVAPHVTRLHLCGEPDVAPHIACAHKAGHAHARIDDWAMALPWLLERLEGDGED